MFLSLTMLFAMTKSRHQGDAKACEVIDTFAFAAARKSVGI